MDLNLEFELGLSEAGSGTDTGAKYSERRPHKTFLFYLFIYLLTLF